MAEKPVSETMVGFREHLYHDLHLVVLVARDLLIERAGEQIVITVSIFGECALQFPARP